MPRRPQWMYLYQIWFRVSSRGHNQLCGILLQSAHGFRFCEGSKFAISHWLGRSPLTQCWRYRAACDHVSFIVSFSQRMDVCIIDAIIQTSMSQRYGSQGVSSLIISQHAVAAAAAPWSGQVGLTVWRHSIYRESYCRVLVVPVGPPRHPSPRPWSGMRLSGLCTRVYARGSEWTKSLID